MSKNQSNFRRLTHKLHLIFFIASWMEYIWTLHGVTFTFTFLDIKYKKKKTSWTSVNKMEGMGRGPL